MYEDERSSGYNGPGIVPESSGPGGPGRFPARGSHREEKGTSLNGT
jgi:hypothetical protein